MRKHVRKSTALLMASAMIMTLAFSGCSKKSESSTDNPTDNPKVEATKAPTSSSDSKSEDDGIKKPEKITIMVDGTFQATKEEGQDEWVAKWEELTGIDLEIIQPDHASYYDVLGQTFASGVENWPDVVLCGSSYYSGYAAEGALWDMTDAWKNSTMYKNDKCRKYIVESNMIDNHLYGLSFAGGGGCITLIRQAWLDKVGLSAPTTYDEYLNMLVAFTNDDPDGNGINDTYGTSAAGFIGNEAPFTNYLPEFYQDAFPTFYQKEDGTWIDGFTEDSMKQAIERLQEAYKLGVIDPETLTNATSNCRTKFSEGKFGAFTYWSGGWAQTMSDAIKTNGGDGELLPIAPIKELGKYWQRVAPCYAITSSCKNPEGVFKYFFESIFDDGEMQKLWTYGVENVHWSQKAETVCGNTYSEGEFHMEEKHTSPGAQWGSCVIIPQVGCILPFTEDHSAGMVGPEDTESNTIYNANNKMAALPVTTDAMSQYNGDLTSLKNSIIADCVVQGLSVEDGYKRFEKEGGQKWSDAILDSLNNR